MQSNFLSHDLQQEFPDLSARVHQLKTGNHHFARRLDEYNGLDKDIVKIEEGLVPMGDFGLEDLKKKRLLLKDELYHMLKSAK